MSHKILEIDGQSLLDNGITIFQSIGVTGIPVNRTFIWHGIETEEVAEKVSKSDRVLGISTFYSPESYARWSSLGVRWLNLNVDFANLYRAGREVVQYQ